MNISLKRTLLAVLVAVFLTSVLLFCGQAVFSNNVAKADDGSSIKLSVDGVADGEDIILSPGKKFTLIVDFSTVRENVYYNSFYFDLSAVTVNAENGRTVKDTRLAKYVKASTANIKDSIKAGAFETTTENMSLDASSQANFGLRYALGLKTTYDRDSVVYPGDDAKVEISLIIDRAILDDTSTEVASMWKDGQLEFHLGIIYNTGSVTYRSTSDDSSTMIDRDRGGAGYGLLTYNTLAVKLNKKSNDTSLAGLKASYEADKIDDEDADKKDNILDENDKLIWLDENGDPSDAENGTLVVVMEPTQKPNVDYIVYLKPILSDENATYAWSDIPNPSPSDPDNPADWIDPDEDGILVADIPEDNEDLGTIANLIYIQVTAEDGTKTVYPVLIKSAYAEISTLEVKTNSKSLGDDVVALNKTTDPKFDPDTKDYTVKVPLDAAAVKIYVSVSRTNGEKQEIKIAPRAGSNTDYIVTAEFFTGDTETETENGYIAGTSTNFTENFLLTGVENDDGVITFDGVSIEITITASNGSEIIYSLTFEAVGTDATLKEFTVTGTTVMTDSTKSTYHNNKERAAKATEEMTGYDEEHPIHYFFEMKNETTDPIKGVFNIELPENSDATVVIVMPNGTEITYYTKGVLETAANTEFAVDEQPYTVKVTAGAGNSEEYKVILSGLLSINLAFDSDYRFEYEYQFDDDGFIMRYRRTYDETNDRFTLGDPYSPEWYEHGAIDLNWETVVLGEIPAQTLMSEFIDNIDSKIHNRLKLFFPGDGEYVYEFGDWHEDYADAAFDNSERIFVGTGWYLEMYNEAKTEVVDTIYLSILGDINGDGQLTTEDAVDLGTYVQTPDINDVPLLGRLTGFIENGGAYALTVTDFTMVGQLIMNTLDPTECYYNPDNLVQDWE